MNTTNAYCGSSRQFVRVWTDFTDVQAGIIGPAKAVRVARQDAASVASLLITTEAMIAGKPKDKPSMCMPGGGGMGGGGMGGMDF